MTAFERLKVTLGVPLHRNLLAESVVTDEVSSELLFVAECHNLRRLR